MANRIGHVDIAKGISILLVALDHSQLMQFAQTLIESMGLFRLPLFFFLSGVFFNSSVNFQTFLWKKSDALLKPYFITLIAMAALTAIRKNESFTHLLQGIFYGTGETIQWIPMWFLPHLFVIYCFSYCIFRLSGIQKKPRLYKLSFLLIMMILGAYWLDAFWHLKFNFSGKQFQLPGLPFSFDLVLVSSSFFIAGSFLKNTVVNFTPKTYLVILSLLILVSIILCSDARIDLYSRIYTNPVLATIAAICGIYFILSTSFYLNKVSVFKRIFLTFGQASLFILIFHGPFGHKAYLYLISISNNELELPLAIIAFLISVLAPLLVKFIVTKSKILSYLYFPIKLKNQKKLS